VHTVLELCTNASLEHVCAQWRGRKSMGLPPGAISFARRLSFSRASRFIRNFIWEYFLKTCASLWRSSCVTLAHWWTADEKRLWHRMVKMAPQWPAIFGVPIISLAPRQIRQVKVNR